MTDDAREAAADDARLEQARQQSAFLQRQAGELLSTSRRLRKASHSLRAELRAALVRRRGQ